MGVGTSGVWLAAVLAVVCAGGAGRAGEVEVAKSARAAPRFIKDHVEISHGIQAAGKVVSAYGAVVVAPVSPLGRDGWRVKLSGGYFQGTEAVESVVKCGTQPSLSGDLADAFLQYCDRAWAAGAQEAEFRLRQTRRIEHYDAAIMPGYQMTFGALIVKAYAGVGFRGQDVPGPGALWNAVKATAGLGRKGAQAAGFGLRGGLETWLTLNDRLWLSTDAYFASGSEGSASWRDTGGTVRLGYRPRSWAALGPEAAVYRTETGGAFDALRAGGFLRFEVNGTETTLSGGMACGGDDDASVYGAANVYLRF